MTTTPRTVTLATTDHGNVTIPEPDWCVGHADHRPVHRTDLSHCGPELSLSRNGQTIGDAVISQAPCAERGTREVQAFVVLSHEGTGGLDPDGVYELAALLRACADDLDCLGVDLDDARRSAHLDGQDADEDAQDAQARADHEGR